MATYISWMNPGNEFQQQKKQVSEITYSIISFYINFKSALNTVPNRRMKTKFSIMDTSGRVREIACHWGGPCGGFKNLGNYIFI